MHALPEIIATMCHVAEVGHTIYEGHGAVTGPEPGRDLARLADKQLEKGGDQTMPMVPLARMVGELTRDKDAPPERGPLEILFGGMF